MCEIMNCELKEMWRFPRFFSTRIEGESAFLSDEDMRHAMTVLRIKLNEKVIICDGDGTDRVCGYSGNVDSGFTILETMRNQAEPSLRLRLFQCLPKSDKMDFIVQKAVELGASEIIPVVSARCVSRPDNKCGKSKAVRWNRIAYEAAKQCGRGIIPKVGDIISYKEAIGIAENNPSIIFYECGGKQLNEILSEAVVEMNVFIGSEGGFESEEIEFAQKHGIVSATLGKRILRVDTASIAAISVIMNLSGNF